MVHQMINDQTTRDDSICSLLSKMNEVYTLLMQEELRVIESMQDVVERICQQTVQCSYLIQKYSQNKKFRKLTVALLNRFQQIYLFNARNEVNSEFNFRH